MEEFQDSISDMKWDVASKMWRQRSEAEFLMSSTGGYDEWIAIFISTDGSCFKRITWLSLVYCRIVSSSLCYIISQTMREWWRKRLHLQNKMESWPTAGRLTKPPDFLTSDLASWGWKSTLLKAMAASPTAPTWRSSDYFRAVCTASSVSRL